MNPQFEKILNFPAYQRAAMLFFLLAAVVGAFTFVFYLPKHEELASLEQKHAQLQTRLQEDRRIARDLPKFRAEYEKLQERLARALAELPNEKEIPTLLTTIAALARDNGLDVLRFRPGNETPKGFYADVPVELKLVGSYHEVAMFFNAVSNLPRIVNIGNLSMGSATTADGRTALTVDCMATTFRFIEGAE
jgi:type IV pilus assembly protein PilO